MVGAFDQEEGMKALEAEFDRIRDNIEHKIKGIVEDHPLTRHLPKVALRNMAYCGAHAAISALTTGEIASCGEMVGASGVEPLTSCGRKG